MTTTDDDRLMININIDSRSARKKWLQRAAGMFLIGILAVVVPDPYPFRASDYARDYTRDTQQIDHFFDKWVG